MSFTRSSARRHVLRITGVLTGWSWWPAGRRRMRSLLGRVRAACFRAVGVRQAAGRVAAGRRPDGRRRRARRDHHDPARAAGLERGGRRADKATGQPMQPQDKVRIGSITKTFVATVVLQLAAEGRLSLDDSVQKLLPGVITGHGYHPAQITVRQLLQQTSGIQDYTYAPGFLTRRIWRRRISRNSSSTSRCGSGLRCTAGCIRTPTTSCSA